MEKEYGKVIIEIRGGVPEITIFGTDVDVVVIDHDNIMDEVEHILSNDVFSNLEMDINLARGIREIRDSLYPLIIEEIKKQSRSNYNINQIVYRTILESVGNHYE